MADKAIPELVWGIESDQDRDAIMATIIAQAGDTHDGWLEAAFKKLPTSGDPIAMRERWPALPVGSARKVALLQWTVSLRGLDAEKFTAELANIPVEARSEITIAMLPQLAENSSALLPALEFAMTSDAWKSMEKSAASQLAKFAERGGIDGLKLAEWGANLPQRPDTVEIYHKATGRHLRDDLPRAREWLEAMPEGKWQRKHGLAEFSQQALWRKSDPASSQWALDSISDPAVKADATEWRHDWEEQSTHISR